VANQTFIAVPPNVEDPVVLRRYLAIVAEQIDTALGNRGGDSLYSEQRKLIESAETLSKALSDAQTQLNNSIKSLEQLLGEDKEDVLDQLNGLSNQLQQAQTDITALESYTAIKGFTADFTVDALNDIVYGLDYNINTSTSARVAVGVYRFQLSQNTYFGQDVRDNCTVSIGNTIAVNAASESYVVEFESTATAGEFEIKVYELTISGTNVIERQAYDIQPGDTIHLTGIFNLPGASLPGV
jgi:hypothetical protein